MEQALDRLAMTELDPQTCGQGGQATGEQIAVTGFITGQPQTPATFSRTRASAGSRATQPSRSSNAWGTPN
jgi:hypothetical protein